MPPARLLRAGGSGDVVATLGLHRELLRRV
jgi:hypothetical protein